MTVVDVARGDNRALTADSAGDYAAPNLTPGIYTVRAAFMGFQTVERQNIEVTVGGDVRVDVTLQPGAQTQTVTVTESIPVVNTTNAQTGGVLENKLLTTCPRSAATTAGSKPWFLASRCKWASASTTFAVDVNGTTDGHGNKLLVDGVYDQTYFTGEVTFGGSGEAGFTTILPLDAIQEVNLSTNPKAEYGWVPGVTTSIGLKSGTNNMHGEAYAFGRDTALSAKNAFACGPTPLGFEQFGGKIGGPIKKNKLFYLRQLRGLPRRSHFDYRQYHCPDFERSGAITSTTEPRVFQTPSPTSSTAMAEPLRLNQLSLNLAGCDYLTIKGITATSTTGSDHCCCSARRTNSAPLACGTTPTWAKCRMPDIRTTAWSRSTITSTTTTL